MKVRDLIKRLKKLNPDALIAVDWSSSCGHFHEAEALWSVPKGRAVLSAVPDTCEKPGRTDVEAYYIE